jgi:DMSO/TMAO reductase YedYZ molybdopterin-dependent catalytic subunit
VQLKTEANRAAASTAAPRSYKGALLRDVLTAAKPAERKPRDLRRGYVIVSATDGYQVVFSWAELFSSPIGNSVIVAYERDGQPISDPEGPIAVVSGLDTGAARHVKWLQSIRFAIAGD